MQHKIILFFAFITMQCFSQQLTYKDIYVQDSLTYKAKDDSIFTGSVENRRWTNGILLSKGDYKDGFIILYTEYYNKSKAGIPYKKTYYYDQKFFKKKKEDRLDYDGTITSTIYFDQNRKKTLEEFFSKGKLVYSCEYKDGKKNGKELCFSKKGEILNYTYSNGKKVIN